MMNIAESITSLIGATPLVRLRNAVGSDDCIVAAKLEQFNPGGSVKDRAALAMVNDAERTGRLGTGGTIIEATSGNMGIAVAMVAAARGYRACIVMPETMSVERRMLLTAYGAEIVLTPAHLGMRGSIDKATELAREIPGSVVIGQFDNPANPAMHEQTTAKEIIDDTDGKIDIFIAGAGTGGTVTGVGKVLKAYNPAIKIVAVEPQNSNVLSGGSGGPHLIQGLGPGFIPSVFDRTVVDEVITVSDQDAYLWTGRIVSTQGILAGISSGAALCATAQYIERFSPHNALIVTLFPDTGERYLSIPQLFRDH